MVSSKLRNFVFVDDPQAGAVGPDQVLPRGGHAVRVGIYEDGGIRGHVYAVRPIVDGDAVERGSIQRDTKKMALERRLCGTREVHQALCFVDSIDSRDLPFTLGELRELLAV